MDSDVFVSDEMMLTKDNATELEEYVLNSINEEAKNNPDYQDCPMLEKQDYLEYCKDYVRGVQQCGCESGIVSDLIYHTQTRQFVFDYESDIGTLVEQWIDGMGLEGCAFLVQDREGNADFTLNTFFDKLAWASYEETARDLMISAGFEDEF